MSTPLQIDFVSDVSCPWCAIGLWSLNQALANLAGKVTAELHFQPFELNPKMPPGGQDIAEHLHQKYGSTQKQQAEIQDMIRQRGAALGFEFRWGARKRIYNTFDAHRLLHWAGLPETQPSGRQLALKQALLSAYFTDGEAPESHDVLLRRVEQVGLDRARAAAILASDDYAAEVRANEQHYLKAGIQSVPAVIINKQFLISGGQPVEVFQRSLEQIVAGQTG